MNLFQRLIATIVPPAPPCDHAAEITHLRQRVGEEEHDRAVARLLLAAELDRNEQLLAERDLLRVQLERSAASDSAARTECAKLSASYERMRVLLEAETQRADAEALRARELRLDVERQAKREHELLEERSAIREEIARLESLLNESTARAQSSSQASFSIPEAGGEVPAGEDQVVSDLVHELAYRMVGLWFEGKHHWVFARGEERIKAPIHDKEFLARMARHEVSFVPGDVVVAEFRVITYRASDGDVYATHAVERVLRIVHADEQLDLTLDGTKAGTPGEEVAHAVAD